MIESEKDIMKEHEFCLRCGRKLKNPIARQKGYGAICEKKMRSLDTKKLFTVIVNNNAAKST